MSDILYKGMLLRIAYNRIGKESKNMGKYGVFCNCVLVRGFLLLVGRITPKVGGSEERIHTPFFEFLTPMGFEGVSPLNRPSY